jgi:ADP-ribose pyrophosphatase YjhB (NUDIX family)
MKFCSECGQTVATEIPAGDNRERYVCRKCDTIHYQNPRIVAGCIPVHDGSILLCKRAIAPRRGFWTVPAGFMELGETLEGAAVRETWEEAEARVLPGKLVAIVDVLQAGQVHIFFDAALPTLDFAAGEETLETRMFTPADIPWDDLAFPSVRIALERHLENRAAIEQDVLIVQAPRAEIG